MVWHTTPFWWPTPATHVRWRRASSEILGEWRCSSPEIWLGVTRGCLDKAQLLTNGCVDIVINPSVKYGTPLLYHTALSLWKWWVVVGDRSNKATTSDVSPGAWLCAIHVRLSERVRQVLRARSLSSSSFWTCMDWYTGVYYVDTIDQKKRERVWNTYHTKCFTNMADLLMIFAGYEPDNWKRIINRECIFKLM